MIVDTGVVSATIDGVALEVTCHAPGTPSTPTLVFLHEGLGSVSLWRDFPQRLVAASGCGALVYSRRGYGNSASLQNRFETDYMHREALETLPALLDHFGIADPVLYGHSDGASIALIHAGQSGRAVRGLVVEAPHVFVEGISLAGVEAARAAFEAGDLGTLARHHQDADRIFRAWNDVWRDPEFRNWSIEDCLPAIRIPVLMIQGSNDAYGTLAQLDAIAASVTGCCGRLVLPNCGHSPHREAADCVLDRVVTFMNGL